MTRKFIGSGSSPLKVATDRYANSFASGFVESRNRYLRKVGDIKVHAPNPIPSGWMYQVVDGNRIIYKKLYEYRFND